MKKVIRVMIADDQEMFRLGLRTALAAQDGIEIVAEARDGKEAIGRASQLRPDVILMDLRMPVMDGIAAIKTLRERGMPAKCLVLTTFEDLELLNAAIAAGAAGYILKGTPIDDVAEVIGIVDKGYSPFSPGLVQLLSIKTGEAASALADDVNSLSQRQRDVFELVGAGMTNRQIAEQLHLSEGTVRNLVSAVLAQLGLHHRTEAALLANHARPHAKLIDRG